MPGASNVEGKNASQIDPKKIGDLCAIMLGRAPEKCLHEKERRHYQKEPSARSLSRGQRHAVRRAKRNGLLLSSVPSEEVPPPEGPEQNAGTTEQHDQGKYAPDQRVGGGMISYQGFGGPVVRVRVVAFWCSAEAAHADQLKKAVS